MHSGMLLFRYHFVSQYSCGQIWNQVSTPNHKHETHVTSTDLANMLLSRADPALVCAA